MAKKTTKKKATKKKAAPKKRADAAMSKLKERSARVASRARSVLAKSSDATASKVSALEDRLRGALLATDQLERDLANALKKQINKLTLSLIHI